MCRRPTILSIGFPFISLYAVAHRILVFARIDNRHEVREAEIKRRPADSSTISTTATTTNKLSYLPALTRLPKCRSIGAPLLPLGPLTRLFPISLLLALLLFPLLHRLLVVQRHSSIRFSNRWTASCVFLNSTIHLRFQLPSLKTSTPSDILSTTSLTSNYRVLAVYPSSLPYRSTT